MLLASEEVREMPPLEPPGDFEEETSATDDELEEIEISALISNVLTLLKKNIKEAKAKIIVRDLPVIKNYRSPGPTLIHQDLLKPRENLLTYLINGI